MTLLEEQILYAEYFHLNKGQRENVDKLDSEKRGLYDKIVILTSRIDFKVKLSSARHTLSPVNDLKTKLVRASMLRKGIEDLSPDIFSINEMRIYYNVALRTYEGMSRPRPNKIKLLEEADPVYCAEHKIGKYGD